MVKTYPFAEIHMNRIPRTDGEVRTYELPADFPADVKQQRFKVVNQDMQVVGRATVNRRKKQITVIFDDFYKNWKGPKSKEVSDEQPTKTVTKRRSR